MGGRTVLEEILLTRYLASTAVLHINGNLKQILIDTSDKYFKIVYFSLRKVYVLIHLIEWNDLMIVITVMGAKHKVRGFLTLINNYLVSKERKRSE